MAHQVKKQLGVTVHQSGADFRVWAPFAQSVALLTPYLGSYDATNRHDMQPDGDGYWEVSVDGAEAGQTYKFQIDTGSETLLRNDPRGRILTASDNGISVVASDYDWGDDAYTSPDKRRQIIYELHIGTFSRKDPATPGTFYDAIDRLPYLQDLGVTTIEVMPVTSMTYGNGWGYNTSDIFSVEAAYGSRRGFMDFVKACHAHNIGVVVDVVYNHFLSSDLWRFDGWYENDRGGIYFYNDERGDTPWGSRPDYGRPEVRQFLLDNIVMWFNEYHVDGLRLDSTAYMRNTEGHNNDPAHDIGDAWSLLQEMTHLAKKVRPDALLIAEDTSVNEYITKPTGDGGCGFDAQWGLDFPHAIRQAIGLSSPYPTDIRNELSHAYNGDPFSKVIFSDSHDTAANGSVRINEAISPGQAASRSARQHMLLANAVTLTAPGIPMLLQGQEFLQEGAFNDWQVLEWENAEKFHGIVAAHQHLIKLRRNEYGNTAGLLGSNVAVFHLNETNHILGYHRWENGGPGDDTLVLINFGEDGFDDYRVKFPRPGNWRVRFNSSWQGYSQDFKEVDADLVVSDNDGMAALPIAPLSVYILSQDA